MRHPRSLFAPLVVAVSSLGALSACDLIFGPPPAVIGDEGREGEGEEGEGEEGEGEEGEGEEGEGEGVGEGEGEGNVGEGEGEGNVGEGEGEGNIGEGEGEGEAGEGEGEGGLVAQLTWTGAQSDIDVRGIKRGATSYCATASFFDGAEGTPSPGPLAAVCEPSANACTFSNCNATDATRPDWDGNGDGASPGDPVIDIDDITGFGPENLSVQSLDDGRYLIGAFAFAVRGVATECATVRLFLQGDLVLTRSISLVSGDWAELAEVVVSGGVATATALEGTAGASCD